MLRLNLKAGPFCVDLASGVRVEVLPMTTETRIRASQALQGPDGQMSDDGVTRDLAYVKAIARAVIIAWEGVGDADGRPVPVTPKGVDALMDMYDLYAAFQRAYVVPGITAADEGNVSAPLPNGTSARAKTTAPRATPPVPPVQGASTRRKRSKAT